MIPPYVGAIAWVQLLNPSVGYLNSIFKWILQLQQSPFDIYTMGGLAWVLTLFYSPFAFITISRAMEKWIRRSKKRHVFPELPLCVPWSMLLCL